MPETVASGFEILDHPADMGFRAWAPTLADLFAECARALTSVLVEIATIQPRESMGVEVWGDDVETLLFNWLAEILYLFDGERKLFSQFSVVSHKSSDGMEFLQAELSGEAFDRERHQVKTYVKAITFHQLKVEHTDKGYQATVFLDI